MRVNDYNTSSIGKIKRPIITKIIKIMSHKDILRIRDRAKYIHEGNNNEDPIHSYNIDSYMVFDKNDNCNRTNN